MTFLLPNGWLFNGNIIKNYPKERGKIFY